ncbi:XF1762 family protein [Nonomuraea sp. NPDC050556]|uniref:XF1762 family protein n=1 Tax=Nonomuraea sp. NPDC050556 TaxID=3364369 RepID=UPI0037B0592B
MENQNEVTVVPVPIQTAKAFVTWTRHQISAATPERFAIGAQTQDGTLVAVAIVSDPIDRFMADCRTVEVTHLAGDLPSAERVLLGAAARAAQAMGYQRLITYAPTARSAGFEPVPDVDPVLWQLTLPLGGQR